MSRRPNASDAEIATMLRAGATSRETVAALRVSPNRVARVRRDRNIPAQPLRHRPRTIAESLALYTEAHGDGHVRWTGPGTLSNPQLWADGRRHNPRHIVFLTHHGRAPDGRVRTTCDQPGCLAGPHLADHLHQPAGHLDLDDLYTAIFGPENPS